MKKWLKRVAIKMQISYLVWYSNFTGKEVYLGTSLTYKRERN